MTNQMTLPGYFETTIPATLVYLWGKLDNTTHKFIARATFIKNGKKEAMTRVFKDAKHERMLDACAEVKAAETAIQHARDNGIKNITLHYHAPCVGGWGDGTWKTGSEYSAKFHETVKSARNDGMTITFKKVERLTK